MVQLLEIMEAQLDPASNLEPHTDTELSTVPSLLRQISWIVEAVGGCATVHHTITDVRIMFFSMLLAKRSFSLTLVLIQDINMLFSHSFSRQDLDPPTDLKPYLEWMAKQKVLQQLLSVNMHQRQYVDAVQKLLENMARVHALDTQTTLKLVESMLQVRSDCCIVCPGIMHYCRCHRVDAMVEVVASAACKLVVLQRREKGSECVTLERWCSGRGDGC
jgi:hypothetical protein